MPGEPLRAKFCGPYEVEKKVNDLNYVVSTPDRRKTKRLCHINMLKQYFERQDKAQVATVQRYYENANTDQSEAKDNQMEGEEEENKEFERDMKLCNSDVLRNIHLKLSHLEIEKQKEMTEMIQEFEQLFNDSPGLTHLGYHEAEVGENSPIKQHPYRVNPKKKEIIEKEIKYMLEKKIIEPSHSEWSSPVLTVPKPDGSARLVVDYRKLNKITKNDTYPIPRIDDCIDRVGKAKYVTKFDLLKGYWQVPLTERTKEVSAFAVHNGLYHFNVLLYGMKNSAATFQRIMNRHIWLGGM